jgi:hypothetical protein
MKTGVSLLEIKKWSLQLEMLNNLKTDFRRGMERELNPY